MKNVKKVIAGVLLTATMLGTGTQLSVGAARYSLEGSSSEVNFNKRPSKGQNRLDTESDSYSVAALFDKVHVQEMKELDDIYDLALCSYYINPCKTDRKYGLTIDECEEKWNEVINRCDEILSYYNESDERDEVKKYNLMKQIANATITWFKAERESTVENWNNVASKFEEVENSIKGTKKKIYKRFDFWNHIQAQAKVDTAVAYAAFVELNNSVNPTEEDYNRVGSLLANVAIENYDLNVRHDGLAEECDSKFEEIYKKVKDMKQEEQNSELLADFTLMKNQIRLIQTDELCKYAEVCEPEERCQLLNEAKNTYDELYYYFMNIGRNEKVIDCYEGLQRIESGYYD